jgi:hypothetical protein
MITAAMLPLIKAARSAAWDMSHLAWYWAPGAASNKHSMDEATALKLWKAALIYFRLGKGDSSWLEDLVAVGNVFKKVADGISTQDITFVYKPNLKPLTRSMTGWFLNEIQISSKFYDPIADGPRTRAAWLFHEFTHYFAQTEDFAYILHYSYQFDPKYADADDEPIPEPSPRKLRWNVDTYAAFLYRYYLS